ncbi:unnamed protein product [Acanthoscelides obtectus]|uniref:Uncharacterized protein n=1 Tax=Acanthoscelides obtectus TaxID=200917 RepID=A0A9P0KYZ3_ACAOB|nr:unnamed protein product [Acanthoscelides obtectus]CAK1677638.1 Flexible cuticle protein 12 [Acanthoscelides obtectus]
MWQIKMRFLLDHIFVSLSIISFCFAYDSSDSGAQILNQDFERAENGDYKFSFETSNGISQEETAETHYEGTEDQFLKVTGSYSYTGPDGVVYTVRYTADDQGFHPEGDHIKVPPFVPWVHHRHEEQNQEVNPQGSNEGYAAAPYEAAGSIPEGERLDLPQTTVSSVSQYLPPNK